MRTVGERPNRRANACENALGNGPTRGRDLAANSMVISRPPSMRFSKVSIAAPG